MLQYVSDSVLKEPRHLKTWACKSRTTRPQASDVGGTSVTKSWELRLREQRRMFREAQWDG